MIDALHKLIPGSASIITSRFDLTADAVLQALHSAGIPFTMKRFSDTDWDLESANMSDTEILDQLRIGEAGHKGILLICTEACSRYDLDFFKCVATEIEEFVDSYNLEMFFDGDVIMVANESRTLSIFHHEGAYAHVIL
jgi:hypothetical protein